MLPGIILCFFHNIFVQARPPKLTHFRQSVMYKYVRTESLVRVAQIQYLIVKKKGNPPPPPTVSFWPPIVPKSRPLTIVWYTFPWKPFLCKLKTLSTHLTYNTAATRGISLLPNTRVLASIIAPGLLIPVTGTSSTSTRAEVFPCGFPSDFCFRCLDFGRLPSISRSSFFPLSLCILSLFFFSRIFEKLKKYTSDCEFDQKCFFLVKTQLCKQRSHSFVYYI